MSTETVNIGPETFKALDGSVLSHEDVNYVPQGEVYRQIDAAYEDGYADGYSDGESEGYAQAQDEFSQGEE